MKLARLLISTVIPASWAESRTKKINTCILTDEKHRWQQRPFATELTQFSVTFDVTPCDQSGNYLISFSNAMQAAEIQYASLVRFNSHGNIDALNGNFFAAASPISYELMQKYRFKMDIDLKAHLYSIWVCLPDGRHFRPYALVGLNFSLREQHEGILSTATLGLCITKGNMENMNSQHIMQPAET
jgi:hypothetical protein